VQVSHERSNEVLASIKCWKILELLSDWWLIKDSLELVM
jgi:hypothetical protein